MKKTLLVLSAIATLFAFVSCGSKGDDTVDGSDNPTTNTTPSGGEGAAVASIFDNAEVALISSYGSAPEVIDEDGVKVLKISAAGNYASWKVILPAAVDISGKKIKVTLKFSSSYFTGDNTFKVAFLSDETHGSEFDHNIAGITTFPTEYADIELSLDKLVTVWSSDNSIEAADFTKIKQINIVPQTGNGDIYIKNIVFVD